MKDFLKRVVREHCPNIPAIRNQFTAAKLREINRYTMAQEDVLAGENDPDQQGQIVARYAQQWPKYTQKLQEKLDEYVSRCDAVAQRSDLDALRVKVLFACYAYGFMPDEFFAFRLENKPMAERQSYISNRDRDNYVYHLNDIIDMDVFLDKYKTYEKYRRYYHREAVSVSKPADYGRFCDFAAKHPVFVRKNVGLSKGDSVELIDSESCGRSARQLFDEMLGQGRYIVEERVVQSAYMSRLNPSSVNTVRVMTFRTGRGVEIGPCFLKVGQGHAFVDNAGQGGIVLGIDVEAGTTATAGFDEFLAEYHRHPDTGVELTGIQLPDWEQARALSKEMSAQMPSVRYIGWDLAHTEDGWVVIEGNGSGQLIIPQIVWQRGFKADIDSLLQE
jgi:hypothetical protein